MIGHRLITELTVYRPGYTTDNVGGRTQTFADQGTIRAQVNQPSSQERLAAAQLGAELAYVVHTAYGADVERGDHLDDGGVRRLRVRAVEHDSHNTYSRLECEVVEGE